MTYFNTLGINLTIVKLILINSNLGYSIRSQLMAITLSFTIGDLFTMDNNYDLPFNNEQLFTIFRDSNNSQFLSNYVQFTVDYLIIKCLLKSFIYFTMNQLS